MSGHLLEGTYGGVSSDNLHIFRNVQNLGWDFSLQTPAV